MLKKIISLAIIALAIIIVVINLPDNKDKARLSTVDDPNAATNFTLQTLEGETVSLADYKGKKVILNFWATWCPPCKAEMPHMQSFYEQMNQEEVVILAVNLTSQDTQDKVETFVDAYGLTFPIALDVDGEVGRLYEIFTIPTTYFIDEEGKIVQKYIGPLDEQSMKKMINSF